MKILVRWMQSGGKIMAISEEYERYAKHCLEVAQLVADRNVRLIQRQQALQDRDDVTETLDVIPRQRFVTEHVREKFSCRSCETITQPPAPFHAIARGFAGPSLLAMMLVEKYANHQPLNPSHPSSSRRDQG